MERDLLGIKTKFYSLGTEVSEGTEASSNVWVMLAKSSLFTKHAVSTCCSGAFHRFSTAAL